MHTCNPVITRISGSLPIPSIFQSTAVGNMERPKRHTPIIHKGASGINGQQYRICHRLAWMLCQPRKVAEGVVHGQIVGYKLVAGLPRESQGSQEPELAAVLQLLAHLLEQWQSQRQSHKALGLPAHSCAWSTLKWMWRNEECGGSCTRGRKPLLRRRQLLTLLGQSLSKVYHCWKGWISGAKVDFGSLLF